MQRDKTETETRDSDERKREVQLCLDTLYFYTINTFESLYFLTFTEVHKLNQFSFYIWTSCCELFPPLLTVKLQKRRLYVDVHQQTFVLCVLKLTHI